MRLTEGGSGRAFDGASLGREPYAVVFISTRCEAIGRFLGRVAAELQAGDGAVLAISADPRGGLAARGRQVPVRHHLGSLHRVAGLEETEIAAVRETLDKAGIDPDQVRRDEVLLRYRRSPSIETIVSGLHMFRDEVERIIREAGVDLGGAPIPHDVTDPKILEAVAAYREEGTLDGAGARLGLSGETVRRRLRDGGLSPDQIGTEDRRRMVTASVEAWEDAGRSLAGAARDLGIDPRTIKAHLIESGVSPTGSSTELERTTEARRLHEIVGSTRAVAMLLGVSPSTARRYLRVGTENSGPPGRPRISDETLDQAELAYDEHHSIRAAARATGMSPGGFAYRLRLARERVKSG